MNISILSGNIGQDPELKYTNSGYPCASVSLATKEWKRNKDGNGGIEETDWHKLVLWGRDAENAAKYLKKGKEVSIVGRSRTRNYVDNNNIKRWVTEVHVKTIKYHGQSTQSRPDSQRAHESSAGQETVMTPEARKEHSSGYMGAHSGDDIGRDEIPF